MSHIVFIDTSTYGVNAIEAACGLGHEVTFVWGRTVGNLAIAGNPPAILQRIRTIANRFIEVDALETADVMEHLERVHRERCIDAVITTSEPAVVPSAQIATHFNCVGPGAEAIERAVLKHRCREILEAEGIRNPRFLVRNLEDLQNVPVSFPFPVVVKPVRGFAKQFTSVCGSRDELSALGVKLVGEREEARHAIRAVISPTYLIESLVPGQLVSAEVIWHAGKLYPMTVTKRLRSSENELVEVAAVMPSGLSYSNEVLEYVERVLKALDLEAGLFHIEVIQAHDGPVLVEINARMMGSISPAMYEYVFGANPFVLLINLHLGKPPDAQYAIPGRAAITLAVGASGSGRTRSEIATELPAYLERFPVLLSNLTIPSGQKITAQKDNITAFGQVILTGTSPSQVQQLALEFLEGLEVLTGVALHSY